MSNMVGEADGKTFMITVDAVIMVDDRVVLIKRANEPYKGSWVLPGGKVGVGETMEEAVRREVMEETGIGVRVLGLVGVYDAIDRDPRGRSISLCYRCEADGLKAQKTSEAEEVRLFDPSRVQDLGFDHSQMLKDALAI